MEMESVIHALRWTASRSESSTRDLRSNRFNELVTESGTKNESPYWIIWHCSLTLCSTITCGLHLERSSVEPETQLTMQISTVYPENPSMNGHCLWVILMAALGTLLIRVACFLRVLWCHHWTGLDLHWSRMLYRTCCVVLFNLSEVSYLVGALSPVNR